MKDEMKLETIEFKFVLVRVKRLLKREQQEAEKIAGMPGPSPTRPPCFATTK
jgi:hypothetical protein